VRKAPERLSTTDSLRQTRFGQTTPPNPPEGLFLIHSAYRRNAFEGPHVLEQIVRQRVHVRHGL
jgi:hypothetical protein